MKTVWRVMSGYRRQYEIEEITIFEGEDKVVFSGKMDSFLNPNCLDLCKETSRILKSECKKCLIHNHKKLFVFID